MYYLESYAEGFDKEYTIKDFTTHEVLRLTKDETRELLHSGVKVYRLSLDENDEIIIEKRKGTIFAINTLEDYAILTDRTYLLDEFDAKKSKVQPYNLKYKQTKEVYWTCPQGHSYKMGVYRRTSENNSRGCPKCSGRVVEAGVNDLKTFCKENDLQYLLNEWNYDKNKIKKQSKPEHYTPHSGEKVWWKCDNGHEFEMRINARTRKDGRCNCPYCSNQKVLSGYNDLETYCRNNNMEYLLEEWDYEKNTEKPSEVAKASNNKFWWKCKERGHSWEGIVADRTLSGTGCPHCHSATSFPEQAILYYLSLSGLNVLNRYKYLDNYEIDVFIPKYNIGIEYDGRAWHNNDRVINIDELKNKACSESGVLLIRLREDGCPDIEMYNAQSIKVYGLNYDKAIQDLITVLENRIGYNLGLDVNLKRDRSSILANYRSHKQEKSIAVTHPEIAREWHPLRNGELKATMFSAGSEEDIWWICWYCGTEWKTLIGNRCKKGKGSGCPTCAKEHASNTREQYTFENEFPEIAEFWDNDFSMMKYSINTHKTISIRCPKCGFKEEQGRLGNRIKSQNGITCKNCNYHVEVQKWNREREEYAKRTKNMSDWQSSMTDYYKRISGE